MHTVVVQVPAGLVVEQVLVVVEVEKEQLVVHTVMAALVVMVMQISTSFLLLPLMLVCLEVKEEEVVVGVHPVVVGVQLLLALPLSKQVKVMVLEVTEEAVPQVHQAVSWPAEQAAKAETAEEPPVSL